MSDPSRPADPLRHPRTMAREAHSRWPGLIWALPLAAVLVLGYLGLQALAHAGVDVVVTFDSAADAKPGDTQVVFKGLSVGRVKKVALSRDRKHVDMTLSLDPSTKPLLRANTQFWLIGAKPNFSDLNSLKAALAGVTIGMAAGDGKPARHFDGLDSPPVVMPGTDGTPYELVSSQVGAARPGANVYYHGLEVGKVTDVDLLGRNNFKTKVFVEAPYNRFVRKGTLFFNVSAVRVSLSGTGISTQLAPGNAALGGGVEFDTPADIIDQTLAAPGSALPLFSERSQAVAGPRGPQVFYRILFTDPVGALEVGAPVTLHGFQIGSVTSRSLNIDPDTGVLTTPVTVGIEPERLNAGEGFVPTLTSSVVAGTDRTLTRLVVQGYRARLAQNPPLVGARVIDLVKVSGPRKFSMSGGRSLDGDSYPVIPNTSSGDVTALTGKMNDILDKVQQMPIVEIGANVRQITAHLGALLGSPQVKDSVVHLDGTLRQLDQTMTQVRPKVGPLIDNLNRAADQVQALATSANAVVSGDGATQDASLPGMLRQLTDTARAFRSLADYLGRHPEALIRGKASEKK